LQQVRLLPRVAAEAPRHASLMRRAATAGLGRTGTQLKEYKPIIAVVL